VHADIDVLGAYVDQLGRKLSLDGVGFIHHSNTGVYRSLTALARRTPHRLLWPLVQRGVLPDLEAWRSETVTAELFAAQCEQAGLACFAQEMISWERGYYLTDALSLFTPQGSCWDRPSSVVRNPLFRREAKRMATTYARRSFPGEAGFPPH